MTLDAEMLARMVEEDKYGLLTIAVKPKPMSSEDRLLASFVEIVEFVESHGREPKKNPKDMAETKLAMRLSALIGNDEHREILAEHDVAGLLREPEPPASLDDVFASDDMGLLGDDAGLHTLTHVPTTQTMPEHIARRKPCEDFDEFKELFEACHRELRAGQRKQLSFANPNQIEPGKFFVMNGILLLVVTVGDLTSNEIGKVNGRTRCVFENGTESDLLLQSLASNLYKDGCLVTQRQDVVTKQMELNADTPMGAVYVLRSLSTDPQITTIGDLHKIGATKQSLDKRVAGADKHPTFLNAPVDIVAEYQVPAAAVLGVEGLLHTFFAEARLDIWFEREGVNVAEAREWFDVSFPVIDEAIGLLESETIGNYVYQTAERRIVLKP